MYAKNAVRFSVAAISLVAWVATVQRGVAQEQGWPINHPTGSAYFPWNASDYRGYDEPRYVSQQITSAMPTAEPQKYEMHASPLPMMKNTEDSKAVTIVAHVPENAQIWFFDKPTVSKGKTRVFYYPKLAAGSYSYTVRIAWVEDGKVVNQSQTISVAPGEVHAICLKCTETKKNPG